MTVTRKFARQLGKWCSFNLVAAFGVILIANATCCEAQSTYTSIHTFVGPEGACPASSLTLGQDGNFYGSTGTGGTASKGTIFKMRSNGTISVLHNFGDGSVANDGTGPWGTLTQASDGSFYGTTQHGGSSDYGTVFNITTSGVVTILHSFSLTDGQYPIGGVTLACRRQSIRHNT